MTAHWDAYSDTSRDGAPKKREECMYDIPTSPASIADEAKMDRAAGRPTVGGRGWADKEAFERDR